MKEDPSILIRNHDDSALHTAHRTLLMWSST